MAKRAIQAFLLLSLGVVTFSFFINSDHEWKYFVYSQWWPQSQCYYKDTNQDKLEPWRINLNKFTNSCVPNEVDRWTIHGLWPTLNGTPNPNYCNGSWGFDDKEIQDLEPRMMRQWLPFPDTSEKNAKHFWKHEWEKHGTCATSLHALNSEHKYFHQTLLLNDQYDLLGILKTANIVPSDSDLYQVEDIENAISKAYQAKGRVVCLSGPDDRLYFAGIRICLDKTFKTRDCIVTTPEHCDRDSAVVYPVIKH